MILTEQEHQDLTAYTSKVTAEMVAGRTLNEARQTVERKHLALTGRVHRIYNGGAPPQRWELLDDGVGPMSRQEKKRAAGRDALCDALRIGRSVSDSTLLKAVEQQAQDAQARRIIAHALGLDASASVGEVMGALSALVAPDLEAGRDPLLHAAALLADGLTLTEVRQRYPQLGKTLEAHYDPFNLARRSVGSEHGR